MKKNHWIFKLGLFCLIGLLIVGFITPEAEALSLRKIKKKLLRNGTVFDAAKYVQNTLALKEYQKQLETLRETLKHLEKMNNSTSQATKAYVISVYNRLIMVRNTVKGLTYSYASLQKEWDETFKDFEAFHGMKASEYANHLKVLDEKTSNALLDAMKSQGFIVDIDGDQVVLKGLMDQSMGAKGMLGALQVANYMAALQMTQMARMELVMAMSFRAQTLYYQWKVQEKMAKRAYAKQNEIKFDNPMNNLSISGAFPQF